MWRADKPALLRFDTRNFPSDNACVENDEDEHQRTPLRALVADTGELFDLCTSALQRVVAAPSDLLTTLSAFLLIASMRDWYVQEGNDGSAVTLDPFHQVVREISNGTKHLWLSPTSHKQVRTVALDFRSYGQGPYGSSTYGTGEIMLEAPRHPGEAPAVFRALDVLEERLSAWAKRLGREMPELTRFP